MILRRCQTKRKAVAAVELALVLPFLLAILTGIWELGRSIHVTQVMYNATRDGARLAAQGFIINTTGAATRIHVATGNPNVEDTIRDSLIGAGITNLNGLTISFA